MSESGGGPPKWLRLAGVLFVLAAPIAAFFYLSPMSTSVDPVAMVLDKAYPIGFEEFKLPSEEWDQARELYDAEQFEQAAQVLSQLRDKEGLKPNQQFFLGMSLLFSGRAKAAADEFRQLASGSGVVAEEAAFYEAVSVYLSGDKPSARIIWETIAADSTHPEHDVSNRLFELTVPTQE